MTSQLTIADALAEEGMARATAASAPSAVELLDRLIAQCAATGERFSANSIRSQLPEGLRPAAIGGRFREAARRGLIRPVDYVPSTDPRTHGHPVRVWQGRTA
ncbi:hypothetical protein Q7689_00110 [Nocardiopsis tropica]|uniref:hypothetical protein n=1 Tax=Nocardiopsis tropica TaxID=109330 RepID=UPI002E8C0927|nr:hypothetical protein [Nocardiopsis tropica]